MGSDSQPFLYNGPSSFSFTGPTQKGFNPRAASEATWRAPLPKPKMDGPLIQSKEFNRHPDSYFVVPYGNLNWTSMSPRTKDKVKWTRIILLLLRILSLCGAGSMLFCVICIRNTDAMTGWIIRVPAGIAILHAVYAIYHLSRSSKSRTPASSASYMLFAATIDISLIPFYVYAALMARVELTEPVGAPDRWVTLFNDDLTTYKIIYSTYLVSVVSGSLHSISFILSLYLGVLYRKISRLPPDMNPLEDNLTSRHKRNKSSLAKIRNSQASTVSLKREKDSELNNSPRSPVRTVPFHQTRNKSHLDMSDQSLPRSSPLMRNSNTPPTTYSNISTHKSDLTLASGNNGPLLDQTSPNASIPCLQGAIPFPGNREGLTRDSIPREKSLYGSSYHQERPRETAKRIGRSLTKSSSIYSADTNTTVNTAMSDLSSSNAISSDHNWVTHPSPMSSHLASKSREVKKAAYQLLPQIPSCEYANDENRPFQVSENPLEMNHPAPKLEQWKQRTWGRSNQGMLTLSNNNMRRQGSWSQGPGTLGIGKVRTWGGVHGLVGHSKESARVVSRSGVEAILPVGGVRAREVSGKVMEEGRGKSSWHVTSD